MRAVHDNPSHLSRVWTDGNRSQVVDRGQEGTRHCATGIVAFIDSLVRIASKPIMANARLIQLRRRSRPTTYGIKASCFVVMFGILYVTVRVLLLCFIYILNALVHLARAVCMFHNFFGQAFERCTT
jgi:hypothetical protein